MGIQISKVDKCPRCFRKLCKRRVIGDVECIEIKHKGLVVITMDAFVQCVECHMAYHVTAQGGIQKEVQIG